MAELFVAPVSIEVLDAALQSNVDGLICSEAQVPPDGSMGYGGIDYTLLRAMHGGREDVIVQRDHLKVMNRVNECDKVLRADRDNGFDAVMLHGWDLNDDDFKTSYRTARELNFKIELGPGEDDVRNVASSVREGIDGSWYGSWPVGLYVEALGNRGKFVKPLSTSLAQGKGKFRAHNCDYLSINQLRHVAKHAAGINLAPQLGTVQSDFYLMISGMLGLPIKYWVDACLADDDRAKRWCPDPVFDRHMRVRACGHYHYDKIQWRGEVYRECVNHLNNYLRKVQDAIKSRPERVHFELNREALGQ